MESKAGTALPLAQAVLLERDRELASLAALIDDAAGGTARVALVEGQAGIGKTQLLGEARRRAAEAQLRVLGARGGELEREFPFGVVRQLFEPQLVDAAGRDRLLSGAAAATSALFDAVPESVAGEPAGDTSFAILHGLYWLTVNLSADGPLLLAVDDLHWCDRPSLRFLAYLVRRLEGLPVLVACSLRPSEPGVDTALLGDITGDALAVSLHPRPLSEGAVTELVRRRLGEQAEAVFAGACHNATGGNPLLLNELLKALETEGVRPDAEHVAVVSDLGPRAASRAVLLRLARLPAEAAAVARALAILGDGAEVTTIAALAGIGEDEAAAAASALARAEIVRPEMPLGFVHPLVAAAVYRDVLPAERELQHARAARLLAERSAPVEQVAAQLLPIPPRADAWVVETLRTAASSALQKGAPESAASYLARALAEPPAVDARPQILLELGLAEALTSGPAAAEHLREAYERLSEPHARTLAAWVLGQTLLFLGFREELAAVARRANAELPPEVTDLRQRLEALELMGVFFGVADDETYRRLEQYRGAPIGAGVGAKMLAAAAANEWTYAGGAADECAALALAALAGGELIAAENALFSTSALIVLANADRDEAMDGFDAALAEAHRRGSLYSASGIHLWRGFTLLRRGELVEAEEELAAVFDDFEQWGFAPLIKHYCAAFLATTLLERGNLAGAERALARVGEPDFVATGVQFLLNSRLELLVAEGKAEEALATADVIARDYGRIVNPAVTQWRSLEALALDRLDRRGEALALASQELEHARRWGAPWALGRSLRVLGTLERDEGLDHLHEAVAALDGSPARLEHAKALAALGTALRLARRPAEAREPLRRALELADTCGAAALAERVRSELYAAGARPRTTALQGVESLTASERRVAALAAEGQTNRDIAQTLFVTPKTVEVHLSNAYRKLGIRSRRDLAPALASP